jgi:hypothetical protein
VRMMTIAKGRGQRAQGKVPSALTDDNSSYPNTIISLTSTAPCGPRVLAATWIASLVAPRSDSSRRAVPWSRQPSVVGTLPTGGPARWSRSASAAALRRRRSGRSSGTFGEREILAHHRVRFRPTIVARLFSSS